VRKKLKDNAFACSVIREESYLSVEALGILLADHIAFVLQAMLPVADEVELGQTDLR